MRFMIIVKMTPAQENAVQDPSSFEADLRCVRDLATRLGRGAQRGGGQFWRPIRRHDAEGDGRAGHREHRAAGAHGGGGVMKHDARNVGHPRRSREREREPMYRRGWIRRNAIEIGNEPANAGRCGK